MQEGEGRDGEGVLSRLDGRKWFPGLYVEFMDLSRRKDFMDSATAFEASFWDTQPGLR